MAKRAPKADPEPEKTSIVERFAAVLADVEAGRLSLRELDQLRGSLTQWSKRLSVAGIDLRQKPRHAAEADRAGAGAPWGRHQAAPVNPAKFSKPRPAPTTFDAAPVRRTDPSTWAPVGGGTFESSRVPSNATHAELERQTTAAMLFADPTECEIARAAIEEHDLLQQRGANLKSTREAHAKKAVADHRAAHDRKVIASREQRAHDKIEAQKAAKAAHVAKVRAETDAAVASAEQLAAKARSAKAEALERLKGLK